MTKNQSHEIKNPGPKSYDITPTKSIGFWGLNFFLKRYHIIIVSPYCRGGPLFETSVAKIKERSQAATGDSGIKNSKNCNC